jgi:hypothetical protein
MTQDVYLARRAAGDAAALALDTVLRADAPGGPQAWQKHGISRNDNEARDQSGL